MNFFISSDTTSNEYFYFIHADIINLLGISIQWMESKWSVVIETVKKCSQHFSDIPIKRHHYKHLGNEKSFGKS